MALMILILPLIAAAFGFFGRSVMTETAIIWVSTVLMALTTGLAWVAWRTGVEPVILLSPWIESATLSSELALEAAGLGPLIVALLASLATLSQLLLLDMPLTKSKKRVPNEDRARLSVLISLFFAASTLFALSAGVIQSVGALTLIAWIAAQFPGLDYRNQGTGRSMQRVFVPLILGVMALLIAAAGLFELRDAVRFEVVFAGDTRTVLVAIAV
ncbi:MAG: hypothetical protein AAFR50_10895, partial [Pseudomonadota bacterium]